MSNITNLKCVVCEHPIEVGEPLLANKSGELAHHKCVHEKSSLPVVHVPSVQIYTPTVEKMPMKLTAGSTGTVPEPCIMPSKMTVCAECGDPCIGMCPICRTYVCQAYGYNNKFCGLKHEVKCPESAKLRTPEKKPETIVIVGVQRNGQAPAAKKLKKKKGRR